MSKFNCNDSDPDISTEEFKQQLEKYIRALVCLGHMDLDVDTIEIDCAQSGKINDFLYEDAVCIKSDKHEYGVWTLHGSEKDFVGSWELPPKGQKISFYSGVRNGILLKYQRLYSDPLTFSFSRIDGTFDSYHAFNLLQKSGVNLDEPKCR